MPHLKSKRGWLRYRLVSRTTILYTKRPRQLPAGILSLNESFLMKTLVPSLVSISIAVAPALAGAQQAAPPSPSPAPDYAPPPPIPPASTPPEAPAPPAPLQGGSTMGAAPESASSLSA